MMAIRLTACHASSDNDDGHDNVPIDSRPRFSNAISRAPPLPLSPLALLFQRDGNARSSPDDSLGT